MSDVAAMRAFNRELAAVIGANVEVVTNTGKTYNGTIKGIDQNSLSIVLQDVTDLEGGAQIPKIFIYGSSIVSFAVSEEEVSLEGLAKELEKSFPPGGVAYYPETATIVVMNKIRVNVDGVEGTGPLYERVKAVADEWLRDRGLA
ncbi:MAG: small nuclear ribonucleoprotein (Sm) [Candidatus Thorarchaeota archaeon]|nr:MAG: small nuclear ribonucleoprotein (Sm) [Candidatus Thorarchaeota archaeon]